MDAVIQQFFNVGIMASVFPLLLRGLGMTLIVCAVVIPLGLAACACCGRSSPR